MSLKATQSVPRLSEVCEPKWNRYAVTMKLLVLIMFFCFATAEIPNLPLLKLPYGTWRATKYDPQAEVGNLVLP